MHIDFYPLQRLVRQYQPELSKVLDDTVRSGWYLNGKNVTFFEQTWASYVGTEHCVSCANGLDALTLVLMAWKKMHRWTDEDEVVVPAFTFAATGLAVLRAGLKPVFCDVGNDALISIDGVLQALTPHTRAVIAVHLYGRTCDIPALKKLQRQHGFLMLEDAAQAHGATYDAVFAGNLGDAAAFSFYPGKNLGALGDAGCICTNDEKLRTFCHQLANYGAETKYIHTLQGLNSRMDEVQASVLNVRIPRLEQENLRRREIAQRYRKQLENPAVGLPPLPSEHQKEVHHIFPVFCKEVEELQRHLSELHIETLRHYPLTLPQQKAFASLSSRPCPQAERLAQTELSLPIHPLLTDEETDYICECINKFNP